MALVAQVARSENMDPGSPQGVVEACGACHPTGLVSHLFGKSTQPFGWEDGLVSDVFAEFINPDHGTMRELASRFDLPLIDLWAATPPEATTTYYLRGNYYYFDQLNEAYLEIQPAL
jgi:hypothetical protein